MRSRASTILGSIAAVLLLLLSNSAFAQNIALDPQDAVQGAHAKGTIVIPQSSIENPGDASNRVHTHIRMFVPATGFNSPMAAIRIKTPPSDRHMPATSMKRLPRWRACTTS